MRINVLGAAGSGKTTLGAAVAGARGIVHIDSDELLWLSSMPPFQHMAPRADRIRALEDQFEAQHSVVVSGFLMDWGDHWHDAFDGVVFLYVHPDERRRRRETRERARLAAWTGVDDEALKRSAEFVEWARSYDRPDFDDISLAMHEQWLGTVTSPVLGLTELESVGQRLSLVERWIDSEIRPD